MELDDKVNELSVAEFEKLVKAQRQRLRKLNKEGEQICGLALLAQVFCELALRQLKRKPQYGSTIERNLCQNLKNIL